MKKSKTGKVFLIGAGPGDPELISLKGWEALKQCDAVIYDHLVSLELVVTLSPDVERYYAGKSAGQHSMKQEDINELLVKLAQEGKTVARLKGGDPFVFGRGGEEAIHLRENKIHFEVIPGITAGVAATASAGIPVTHRGKAVYTIFLTAHEAPDKPESQLPWEKFAQLENGTLVGYMGVGRLAEIAEILIKNGKPDSTPAAVIERGTLGNQRVVSGTLQNIARNAAKAGIAPPALFIIGDTVALQKSIGEKQKKPLSGKVIMVTRPANQALDMYRRLRELGAEVLPLPTISTKLFPLDKSWRIFNDLELGWLIFTSENGVRYFFRQFFEAGYDIRRISDFQIAVVGAGTEKALAHYGLRADFIPQKFTVRSLAEELSEIYNWNGIPVIRLRGNLGDLTIEERLSEMGARVYPFQVYKTEIVEWDAGMRAAFEEAKIDAVTFTSGSTVTSLVNILGAERFDDFMRTTKVVSIGPMTSNILREFEIEPAAEAEIHSLEGVIEAIMQLFTTKSGK